MCGCACTAFDLLRYYYVAVRYIDLIAGAFRWINRKLLEWIHFYAAGRNDARDVPKTRENKLYRSCPAGASRSGHDAG